MVEISIPCEVNEDLAEEIGWHIGDGSMNFYKNGNKMRGVYQLRGHIEDDVSHYIHRIKPLFKKIYGIDVSLRRMESTRVFGFQIWNCNLVAFKKRLGLPLGKKFNVEIPQVFLKDDDLKKAVLRGIFDTDGGIYLERKNNKLYPRMYITTISFELAKQLLEIFKKLEFRTTMHLRIDKRESKRLKLYSIDIRGVKMFHKFINEINPQNPKHMEKYKIFLNSQNL